MPVLLTREEEFEMWLGASADLLTNRCSAEGFSLAPFSDERVYNAPAPRQSCAPWDFSNDP